MLTTEAPNMRDLGKMLLVLAAALAIVGGLLTLGGRIPGLGKLPGDFVWRRGNTTVYFPLATSLILSVVLSALLWWLGRRSG